MNVTLKKRIIIANPPALEATERNAVMVIGAPSYTSGAQKWNGTAEILYPKPARARIPAMTSAYMELPPRAIMAGKLVVDHAEVQGSGQAVEDRNAVQHHPGGKRRRR